MSAHVTRYTNVTSAADTPILAQLISRGFQIEEEADGASAGLQITWPDGSMGKYVVGDGPISVGNITGNGMGPIQGVPAGATNPSLPMPGGQTQPASPATQYCLVRSLGATTIVRCTEFA
ncbi:MAG: hypothetical protein KGL39_47390 [Patescibacteria group bacterium]|nr:hypothetical protein [Patescibacteria group bacterium]